VTTLTLNPIATADPSPRVELVVSAVDGGVSTVTVLQLSSEGQVVVRNGRRISAAGGAFLVDYEVPLGVPVEYRLEQFNGAGTSLGFTSPVSTQVDIPIGMVVIQDPLAPANAVMLRAERSFAETTGFKRSLQLYPSGNDTIALMGERGLLDSVNLSVIAEADDDQTTLDAILAEGTLLVRTMPPMPVPRALHVVIDSPRRVPFDAHWGGQVSVYQLEGSQVSMLPLDIIVPVVTWQRVIDAYPTWTALMAAHATWLDLIKNPPPEV